MKARNRKIVAASIVVARLLVFPIIKSNDNATLAMSLSENTENQIVSMDVESAITIHGKVYDWGSTFISNDGEVYTIQDPPEYEEGTEVYIVLNTFTNTILGVYEEGDLEWE